MHYAEQRFSSRQAAGIGFVVVLHVAIIYALVSGLGEQAVQVFRQPLEAKIITPAKLPPPEALPPPPPQMLAPPPPYVPPPLVQIAEPRPVPVIASVTHVQPAAHRPVAAAPQPVARTGARLETGGCSAPQYPEQAEDDNQSGTTVMQFLISTTGAVLAKHVAVSSGHAVLDDAALGAIALCRFSPAIGADGNPQAGWVTVPYIWQLPED